MPIVTTTVVSSTETELWRRQKTGRGMDGGGGLRRMVKDDGIADKE